MSMYYLQKRTPQISSSSSFRYIFGADPDTCATIWIKIQQQIAGTGFQNVIVEHLLWALYVLKQYGTEIMMAAIFQTNPKTFQKWSKVIVIQISKLHSSEVSKMNYKKLINVHLFDL
jgi:hypothetical protein